MIKLNLSLFIKIKNFKIISYIILDKLFNAQFNLNIHS